VARRGDRRETTARAWDLEYGAGRYRDESPLLFVADILAAAREYDLLGAEGLYSTATAQPPMSTSRPPGAPCWRRPLLPAR
jgi:hypothetical protein